MHQTNAQPPPFVIDLTGDSESALDLDSRQHAGFVPWSAATKPKPPAYQPASAQYVATLLPFPMSASRATIPQDRVRARGTAPSSTVQDVERATGVTFTADSSKFSAMQTPEYFGVREGRQPGIYYSQTDLERQTDGYQSVWQGFATGAEVEDYLHHEPEACMYNSCSKICKKAANRAKQQAKTARKAMKSKEVATAPSAVVDSDCECCGVLVTSGALLCPDCFDNPAAWLETIIEKNGLVLEQASVMRSVAQGTNVFFTGAAGTGKSTLIRSIQKYMAGLNANVQSIAHSGIAALNIEGRTIYSFASWDANIDRVSIEDLCDRARRKTTWKRLTATDVLIIDEISMVESSCLTRLSQIMQATASTSKVGNHQLPFGGVQIVISGDFYQLPPVKPMEHCGICGQEMSHPTSGVRRCRDHGDFDYDDRFAFGSPVWASCEFNTTELKQMHRQADSVFTSILSPLRKGFRLTTDEEDTLLYHPVDISRDDAIKLVPTRAAARQINDYYINRIPSRPIELMALDNFRWEQANHHDLSDLSLRVDRDSGPLRALKDHRYEFQLELKRDMLVLLITNFDRNKGLVNGSVGRIVDFVDMKDENMPRAQGMKKKPGERSGPVIVGEHGEYQEAQIHLFRARLPPDSRKWPVVQFKNGVKQIISACCTVSERGGCKPYSLLSRTQVPLLPGYAMTVHASQGMTLENVVVDLARCWEAGQAYVTLSRAKSLSGLIVDTLPTRVPFDPVVEEFMMATFGDGDRFGDDDLDRTELDEFKIKGAAGAGLEGSFKIKGAGSVLSGSGFKDGW